MAVVDFEYPLIGSDPHIFQVAVNPLFLSSGI